MPDDSDLIRVRIAVAVDHTGNWSSVGFAGMDDDDAFSFIIDNVEPGENRYFVEATLRKPSVVVVEAEKVEAAHKETTDA